MMWITCVEIFDPKLSTLHPPVIDRLYRDGAQDLVFLSL